MTIVRLWEENALLFHLDMIFFLTIIDLQNPKISASGTFSTYRSNELRSFRLPPVRLRLDSIRLRTVCQFAYVLNNYCIKQLIHQLDVLSRSQPI